MDLMERLEWLLLGGVIGFVLGYFVGKLRDIKEELDQVTHDVKRIRNQRGVMSRRLAGNIALGAVVALTCYAAVMSQLASNKSNDTADKLISIQADQKQNLNCTTQVLFDAIKAINERTTYTKAQADANIELIRGQLAFLTSLSVQPPPSQEEALANYNKYVEQVSTFLNLAEKTRDQQIKNPYPTVEDLTSCLVQVSEDEEELK